MGEELYETQLVVRAVLDYHDGLLAREMDASLLKAMFGQSKGLANRSGPSQQLLYGSEVKTIWNSA